ncbi:MAG: hypothetical protein KKB34_01310 [Bacteroidetes bacterium]|nr:hypothetical protein [Bacteroidota bacterium]
MTKIFVFILMFPLASICAQSNLPAGVWIKFVDDGISHNLIDYTKTLNEDTLIQKSSIGTKFNNGVLYYWNGASWQAESNDAEPLSFYISLKMDDKAVMFLGIDGNSTAEDYNVFTDEGWVHVKSKIKLIPGRDKIFFDEDNKRFILIKENVPWIFNLE